MISTCLRGAYRGGRLYSVHEDRDIVPKRSHFKVAPHSGGIENKGMKAVAWSAWVVGVSADRSLRMGGYVGLGLRQCVIKCATKVDSESTIY
jgi:hypothetical protein